MSEIKVLPVQIANKIAAGEVVERPASVIKELVENSVDAGAKAITIEIQEGGLSYMRVSDNGKGMSEQDAKTCFLRHATSKIHDAEDLYSIATLGFRGEALASIAAVARVRLKTHPRNAKFGTQIIIDGGFTRDCSPCGCPDGTVIEVEDLFYNVPARKKFIKSARTEASYVCDYCLRMILARPDISFKLISNGKVYYHSRGDGDLKNAIYSVYGGEIIPHLKEVDYLDDYIMITGYVCSEHLTKPNRSYQSFFVNDRYIKSLKLSSSLQSAYDTRIMGGRFPIAVISLKMNYSDVDVNVHPNKLEVKFTDEGRVCACLHRAVKDALCESSVPTYLIDDDDDDIPEIPADKDKQEEFYRRLMGQANFTDESAEQTKDDTGKEDTTPDRRRTQIEELALDTTLPVYTVTPQTDEVKTETETVVTQVQFDASPYVIIGSLFDSFWLISQNDNLFIMDQHAAHERMIYEQLISGELKANSQVLLVPFIIKLTNEEYNTYLENADLFTEFGFCTEEFGTLTLRITAVPYILKKAEDDTFFRDALAELQKKKSVTLLDMKREALITASCKGAVKLGNKVPVQMIESLLDEYNKNGITLTCPHGRPVMFAITKKELFKKFKRIL